MEYSKIKSVEVFNFMGYKHAIMNFDDKQIINLKGFNSGGKSSLLKACAVCLINLYAREQAKLIKHGEDYFRVIVRFDDGVLIVRDKYLNGQSLYEMYSGKKCLYSSKQGSKLAKIDGVPTIIQDYLGLLTTETGCLNYQTRDDLMYLAETKGSENYFSLNEVLKTVELARANAIVNSDKNKLNSDIAGIEGDIQQSTLLLQSLSDINEELIVALSEREMYAQGLIQKVNYIERVQSTLSELDSLVFYPLVENIDIRKMNSCLEIQNSLLEIGKLVKYPELSSIGVTKLSAIENLYNTLGTLSKLDSSLVNVTLEVLNIDKYQPLNRLHTELKDLGELLVTTGDLKKEEELLIQEREKLVNEAKEKGIKFVVCDNCGTMMEVETNG